MPGLETDVPGCDRETNAATCGGGAVLGAWSSCTGPDICGYDGTHRRTRRDLSCSDGGCNPGPEYDEMESCPRDTDGTICLSYPCDYYVCSGGSCGSYGGSNCEGGMTCSFGSYCDYFCPP